MKKAVAKCNQVDAPELELPPYRSVDRFVNTMLSFARDMESNQFVQLYKMRSVMTARTTTTTEDIKPDHTCRTITMMISTTPTTSTTMTTWITRWTNSR